MTGAAGVRCWRLDRYLILAAARWGDAEGFGLAVLPGQAVRIASSEAFERVQLQRHRLGVTSNGIAAGPTAAEARARAREELIERFVALQAWQQQCGGFSTRWRDPLAQWVERRLAGRGWCLTLRSIPGIDRGVLAGWGQHPRWGRVFDAAYGDSWAAQRKLALSLWLQTLNEPPARARPLPRRGTPEDHEGGRGEIPGVGQPRLWGIAGIQTRVLVEAGEGPPAVAIAYHPGWPELAWGRLSLVPGGTAERHPLV